jgi:hypothetical protein
MKPVSYDPSAVRNEISLGQVKIGGIGDESIQIKHRSTLFPEKCVRRCRIFPIAKPALTNYRASIINAKRIAGVIADNGSEIGHHTML